MKDCCQDKTSPYDIRDADNNLIRACISFGDALLSHTSITQTEIEAIRKMLQFLRRLPEPPPYGLHGEFGFRIEPDVDDWEGGHLSCWSVSVCRAMFEIFSCQDDEEADELSWLLCPGQQNFNDLTNAPSWIAEVSKMEENLKPGQRLVVEASTWSISEEKEA